MEEKEEKSFKKVLTYQKTYVILNEQCSERYRRGHNEAVLKTVCPQGHVGSNPTLSAEAVSFIK